MRRKKRRRHGIIHEDDGTLASAQVALDAPYTTSAKRRREVQGRTPAIMPPHRSSEAPLTLIDDNTSNDSFSSRDSGGTHCTSSSYVSYTSQSDSSDTFSSHSGVGAGQGGAHRFARLANQASVPDDTYIMPPPSTHVNIASAQDQRLANVTATTTTTTSIPQYQQTRLFQPVLRSWIPRHFRQMTPGAGHYNNAYDHKHGERGDDGRSPMTSAVNHTSIPGLLALLPSSLTNTCGGGSPDMIYLFVGQTLAYLHPLSIWHSNTTLEYKVIAATVNNPQQIPYTPFCQLWRRHSRLIPTKPGEPGRYNITSSAMAHVFSSPEGWASDCRRLYMQPLTIPKSNANVLTLEQRQQRRENKVWGAFAVLARNLHTLAKQHKMSHVILLMLSCFMCVHLPDLDAVAWSDVRKRMSCDILTADTQSTSAVMVWQLWHTLLSGYTKLNDHTDLPQRSNMPIMLEDVLRGESSWTSLLISLYHASLSLNSLRWVDETDEHLLAKVVSAAQAISQHAESPMAQRIIRQMGFVDGKIPSIQSTEWFLSWNAAAVDWLYALLRWVMWRMSRSWTIQTPQTYYPEKSTSDEDLLSHVEPSASLFPSALEEMESAQHMTSTTDDLWQKLDGMDDKMRWSNVKDGITSSGATLFFLHYAMKCMSQRLYEHNPSPPPPHPPPSSYTQSHQQHQFDTSFYDTIGDGTSSGTMSDPNHLSF